MLFFKQMINIHINYSVYRAIRAIRQGSCLALQEKEMENFE